MSLRPKARALARSIRRQLRPAGHAVTARPDELASPDSPVLVTIPPLAAVPDGPGVRLTVLMPHLQLAKMTGGPNTIIILTGRLVERGVAVRYVATYGPLDRDEAGLRAHIASLTGSELAARTVELVGTERPLPVAPGDVFMATWWPTAYVAREAMRHARAQEFVYLIQDFEPGFYPWSTNYALAEATYSFPCRAIFNEHLLRAHFAASRIGRFDAGASPALATAFDPSVDRARFSRDAYPADAGRRAKRRLLLYARPKIERNLFTLSLRSLRAAVQTGAFDGEDWEFVATGADIPELALSRRHVLRPAGWLGYPEYARLISQSDLLLSLMLSPHTSYPPIEMAAAGNLVVTNTMGAKTAEALRSISPRLIGVAPTEVSLVEALRVAASMVREGRVPGGDVALPGTWEAALADAVPWLAITARELAAGTAAARPASAPSTP